MPQPSNDAKVRGVMRDGAPHSIRELALLLNLRRSAVSRAVLRLTLKGELERLRGDDRGYHEPELYRIGAQARAAAFVPPDPAPLAEVFGLVARPITTPARLVLGMNMTGEP
jgi:DNA-binding IclR family transcriptional regulator